MKIKRHIDFVNENDNLNKSTTSMGRFGIDHDYGNFVIVYIIDGGSDIVESFISKKDVMKRIIELFSVEKEEDLIEYKENSNQYVDHDANIHVTHTRIGDKGSIYSGRNIQIVQGHTSKLYNKLFYVLESDPDFVDINFFSFQHDAEEHYQHELEMEKNDDNLTKGELDFKF